MSTAIRGVPSFAHRRLLPGNEARVVDPATGADV
jgi:hypothetical protein